MAQLVALIKGALQDGNSLLETDIFGTDESSAVAHQVTTFLESSFGEAPTFIFYRHSVGVVVGASFEDRDVVLKIHRWRASLERLTAIQRVQREYFHLGLPAPRPLLAPAPFASGIATIEELIPGDIADGHDSEIRRVLARELHRFIDAGRNVKDVRGLDSPALLERPHGVLWPTPHSPRFDFDATYEGAQWIDDFAHGAQRRLVDEGAETVIGYLDWRVGNLGFAGSALRAIYDWDSVGLASEAFIVGSAAATFSSDWSKPNGSVPNLDEMRSFVGEYEGARGKAFDDHELDVVDAANLVLVAYGARCQHSDATLVRDGSGAVSQSWIDLLVERGDRGLVTM